MTTGPPRIATYTDARGIVSAACGCALYTLARGMVLAQPCEAHEGRMTVRMGPRECAVGPTGGC